MVPGGTPAVDSNKDTLRIDCRDPVTDQKNAIMAGDINSLTFLFRKSVPGIEPRLD